MCFVCLLSGFVIYFFLFNVFFKNLSENFLDGFIFLILEIIVLCVYKDLLYYEWIMLSFKLDNVLFKCFFKSLMVCEIWVL